MSFDYRGIYLLSSSYGIVCPTKEIITDQLVGAMSGLLAWRFMTPQARRAWDAACSHAAFTIKPSGNTFLSSTYFQLSQLRKRTFPDPAFNAISLDLIVQNPWSLTDSEFATCRAALAAGNFPSLSSAKPADWSAQYELYGALAGNILTFVALKSPQFAAKAIFGTTLVGAAVGIGSAAYSGYQKLEIGNLRVNYEVDYQRRSYAAYEKTFV